MKITLEFKNVNEYIEFKEKTAQEVEVQEQKLNYKDLIKNVESDKFTKIGNYI